MSLGYRFFLVLAAILALSLPSVPALAQASRTWVSGLGDDVNPCSRTAPCKTFAGAISKTAAGGEIGVLDPGGYGQVTITKSISIVNGGAAEASILVAGGNGINVAAGAQDVVRIRGLIVDGAGNTQTSGTGIRFQTGAELHVEGCLIKNFQSPSAGFGIDFAPNANAMLYVSDTVLVRNGSSTNGGGLRVVPTNNSLLKVVLNRVQSYSNGGFGLKADGTTSTGRVFLTAQDSVMANNTHGIWAVTKSDGANISLQSHRNLVMGNRVNGVLVDGSKANVLLAGTNLNTNDIGVAVLNGASWSSYGNNSVISNLTTDALPPPTALTTK